MQGSTRTARVRTSNSWHQYSTGAPVGMHDAPVPVQGVNGLDCSVPPRPPDILPSSTRPATSSAVLSSRSCPHLDVVTL